MKGSSSNAQLVSHAFSHSSTRYWTPYVWNELHKLVPRIQKFCAGLDITVQDGEPQVLPFRFVAVVSLPFLFG